MKLMYYTLGMLSFCSLFFVSCERDDLCVDVPVTPQVVVVFENNDPTLNRVNKSVQNLQIRQLEDLKEVFETPVSTDSIRVPLNNSSTSVRYVFSRNEGDANTANQASDTLELRYTTTDTYVNRACGFKTTYEDFNVERVNTTSNWISDIIVEQNTIENEDVTHLVLLH